ncbi:hypothetical protein ACE14D_10100 [Streptomyces sp. Act-28]
MRLHLGPDALVTPTDGILASPPRYHLDIPAVSVCTAIEQHEHEQLLRSTFGSVDWLWSGDDEFRFQRSSRILTSLSLRVPEINTMSQEEAHAWLDVPPKEAGLQALSDENFSVPPAHKRWLSEEADWLVCTLSTPPARKADTERLRITGDLDLVFEGGIYSGWVLKNPADHLASGSEGPPSHTATQSFKFAFKKFMDFFIQPTYDLMAEEDPNTLGELESLRDLILRLPEDVRRKALLDQIADQHERWYG